MLFILTHSNQEVDVHLLGGYWKLPMVPVDTTQSNVSLTIRHKSKVKPGAPSAARISKQDFSSVKNILKAMLPFVYINMLTAA